MLYIVGKTLKKSAQSMSFATKLQAVGMNRTQLGEKLGVHRQTVSRWGRSCPKYVEVCLDLMITVQELQKDLAECRSAVRVITSAQAENGKGLA